jgi:hypothetical protein
MKNLHYPVDASKKQVWKVWAWLKCIHGGSGMPQVFTRVGCSNVSTPTSYQLNTGWLHAMAELEELLKHFRLSEEVSSQQVSYIHIYKLQAHCRKWRLLPPYLGMEDIIAEDIDRGRGTEEEKRIDFLKKWKDVKGSNATFKVLIGALLDIRQRYDAEGVCKILQAAPSAASSTTGKLGVWGRKGRAIGQGLLVT